MRKITVGLAALGMLASGGVFAQEPAEPTIGEGQGQPNENAAPIAQERATRNSVGGDREKGGFGPAQAEAAQQEGPYGQRLQSGGWTGSAKDR